jgi:hypothetical protein
MQRSADQLAQMRRCSGHRQCTRGIALRQSQTSVTFHCSCDTTPMPQDPEDFQGFTVCGMSGRMVALLTVDVPQICERPRGTPRVGGFAKGRERTLVEPSSGSYVPRLARDVALLVDRPRGSAAVASLFEYVGRLTQGPSSARIIAANSPHWLSCEDNARSPVGPTAYASMRGSAQCCFLPRNSHPDPVPIPPKHSRRLRYPAGRPPLHKEKGCVSGNVRRPDNRPERWPGLR